MQKPSKEIKVKKYVLPTTELKPLNGRIYCDIIRRVSKVTKAGIHLPVSYFLNDSHGNPTIEIKQNRYFVVAIAHDFNLKVPGCDGKLRSLAVGDEIIPQENPDAIGWTLPVVRDYDQETVLMLFVLHESEIFGLAPDQYEDVMVEDESPETKVPEKPLPEEN